MADEFDELDIPTVAMDVILNAGDGRMCIDKAMEAMAALDFDAAEKHLEDAEQKILAAHRSQTEMIQREAAGEKVEFSILFVHSQDTLMTIAAELHMAKKMLPVVKALANK